MCFQLQLHAIYDIFSIDSEWKLLSINFCINHICTGWFISAREPIISVTCWTLKKNYVDAQSVHI